VRVQLQRIYRHTTMAFAFKSWIPPSPSAPEGREEGGIGMRPKITQKRRTRGRIHMMRKKKRTGDESKSLWRKERNDKRRFHKCEDYFTRDRVLLHSLDEYQRNNRLVCSNNTCICKEKRKERKVREEKRTEGNTRIRNPTTQELSLHNPMCSISPPLASLL